MRLSPSLSSLAGAFALLVLPAALQAQTPAAPAASRPIGCRGVSSNTSSVSVPRAGQEPWVFPSYPEIEDVQPGSPAERAGFRPGDRVILQGGRDVVGNPPTVPALAGDTVVFVVRRDGNEVPLTVVLGRWDPAEESPGVERICKPLAPSGSD